MNNRPDLRRLIEYNVDVLSQGLHIIEAHLAQPECAYEQHSGPHLRHVIEHYEAFLRDVGVHAVDYDSRDRDPGPERDPLLARERIMALQQRLRALDVDLMDKPIAVHLRGGLAGEENFVSFSSLKRELLFLASHTTHHYAVLRLHCRAQGIDLGEDFGKAPSTVRHARQS